MKKVLLLAIPLLFLVSGCTSMKEILTVSPQVVERPPLTVQTPRPAIGYPFDFILITPENVEAKLKELKDSGKDVVFFALTDDGYKALSLSVAELRRYIVQQNAVIKAYKDYYLPSQDQHTDSK